MLFHLAYRPLTLGNLEGHSDIAKFLKKNNFSPELMKLYILVLNRFLIKIFGLVLSQDMEFNQIGDTCTSAHFSDKGFWLRPQNL